MDTFLERHTLLKLIQEEIENLSRFILGKEIKLVTKKLPTKKGPKEKCLCGSVG